MTRTSSTSLIALAFAAAAFTMLSQGASAATANTDGSAVSAAEMTKYCARLANKDTSACREFFVRTKKRQLTAKLVKDSDGGGGGGGNSGRGGRGGQK